MSEIETGSNDPSNEEPVGLHGMKAIITYFTNKLFPKIYSYIHEVSEPQIDNLLEEAWRDTFKEEPPQL